MSRKPTSPPDADGGKEARFVLKAMPGMSHDDIKGALAQTPGPGPAMQVEPLFELEDTRSPASQQLARYFVLTLPPEHFKDAPPSRADLLDIAYDLRDLDAFASVDPDIPAQIMKPPRRKSTPSDTNDPAWAIKHMRVDEAWNLPGGQAKKGKGIVIGHPDTGWAHHTYVDFADYDLTHDKNFVNKHKADNAEDPLDPIFKGLLRSPGHGTATASVAVSLTRPGKPTSGCLSALPQWLRSRWRDKLPAEALISGVAPEAQMLPIRCTDSVFAAAGTRLAESINYAAQQNAGVISISLGSLPWSWLEDAVKAAVHNNCIVIAAAGQPLPLVVAPAVFDDCIAVAATDVQDRPCEWSGRGPEVTISAPGEAVWRATFDRFFWWWMIPRFERGDGTSFATANVTGVAALWLAYHGRENLLDLYRGHTTLQVVFKHLLKKTVYTPKFWEDRDKDNYGNGIVNAEALLEAALPEPGKIATPVAFGAFDAFDAPAKAGYRALRQMGQSFVEKDKRADTAQAEKVVQDRLSRLLRRDVDVEALAEDYSSELMYLFIDQLNEVDAPPISRRLQAALGKR